MVAIIPARYSSVRLPGKMMADVLGKPLIVRTMEQAARAEHVSRVIVATDDQRIAAAVKAAGGEAVLTAEEHVSGSDRIAEVAKDLPEGTIIVNVQGDEPLISPETIDRTVAVLLNDPTAQMATACEPLRSLWGELLNFNVVKIALGEGGNALYFSRSPMPFPREAALRHDGDPNRAICEEPEVLEAFRKHVGVYAYRREFLLEFTQMPPTRLERIEMLEQLRALEYGAQIDVVDAVGTSIGVDTESDLERVRAILMLPDISIRKARVEDIPAVAKVHVESWQRSFRGIAPDDYLNAMSVEDRIKKLTERSSRPPYQMLIAEHSSGQIAGFIDFGDPVLDVGHQSQIYSFYLLPAFQRLGLGTHLFRRGFGEMRDQGVTSVCLDALAASPYRGFYEKFGGVEIGRDTHKLGNEDFETVIYGWREMNAL